MATKSFAANKCLDKLDSLIIYRWHMFIAELDDEPVDIQYNADKNEVEIFTMFMDYVNMLDGKDPLAYYYEKMKEYMFRE